MNQLPGEELGTIILPAFGVDVYNVPSRVAQGFVTRADNLIADYGSFQQRWAKIGQIAHASINTGKTIPQLIEYYDTSGVLWLVYVQDGKLWKLQTGSTGIPVQIPLTAADGTTTVTLDTAKASIYLYGTRIFIVDGTIDLTVADLTSGTVSKGQSAPTNAPTAVLTDTLIIQTYNKTWWSAIGAANQFPNTLPGLNDTVNGQFGPQNSNIGHGGPYGNWTRFGHDPDMTGIWFNMDNYDEGAFVTANSVIGNGGLASGNTPGWITNARYSTNPANPAYTLRPNRFFAQIQVSRTKPYSGRMFLAAYTGDSGDGTLLGVQEYNFASPVVSGSPGAEFITAINGGATGALDGSVYLQSHVFDFSGLPESVPVGSYAIWIQGGAENNRGDDAHDGFLVNNLSLVPMSNQIGFITGELDGGVYINPGVPTPSVSSSSTSSGSSNSSSSSLSSSSSGSPVSSSSSLIPPNPSGQLPAFDIDGVLDLEYTSIVFDINAAIGTHYDFSKTEIIYFGIGGAASWKNLAFNLYLHHTGDDDLTWYLATNGATLALNKKTLECDITTIDPNVLTSIDRIRLQFATNPTWVTPFNLLEVGPLFEAGNLSVDVLNNQAFADYAWEFTEVDVIVAPDLIEGNGSPVSNPLTATVTQAEAFVSLPTGFIPNVGANYIGYYRRGGTYSDGLLRRLAFVPVGDYIAYGTDVNDPAGVNNPYISWNAQIVTATTMNLTTAAGANTIHVSDSGGFDIGSTIFVNDGTRKTHFTITAKGAGTITGTLAAIAGDSATGVTILSGAVVNEITNTLLDNTPDSFLEQAETIPTTHGIAEAGLQFLNGWQGRLFASKNSILDYSQLFNPDTPSAVYWNTVNIKGSATEEIEGGREIIGDANSSDNILGFGPFGTPVASTNAFGGVMFIGKTQDVFVMSGTNAGNFVVTQQSYGEGVGLIARGCISRYSAFAIAFLGNDRGHLYPQTYRHKSVDVEQMWQPIEPWLYPNARNGFHTITSTAAAKAVMVYHDSYLFIAYPNTEIANQTDNSVLIVYNARTGGWTRWTGMPFASLCPTGASPLGGHDYALYAGGLDGQIYKLDPNAFADIAYPGATPTALPLALTSRGIGSEGAQFRQVKAKQSHIDANLSETLTLRVANNTGAFYYDDVIPWPGVRYRLVKNYGNGCFGDYCTVGFTVSTTNSATFYALDLTVAHGEQKR